MEDFQGNSSGIREDPAPKRSAIATNVIAKKSGGNEANKITKRFFSEDAKSVGAHVIDSIVIPSAQKLLSDLVKGAIDWIIYGRNGSQRSSGVGTISYGSYYNRSGVVNPAPVSYNQPNIAKPTLYAVNEFIIPDRGEAEEVLIQLKEAIDTYGMVSVGDFYDLLGQRGSFTDQKWGWFDLKSADIIRVADGYMIRFPRVSPLEK